MGYQARVDPQDFTEVAAEAHNGGSSRGVRERVSRTRHTSVQEETDTEDPCPDFYANNRAIRRSSSAVDST